MRPTFFAQKMLGFRVTAASQSFVSSPLLTQPVV